jgi:hypothetical protein
VPCIRNRPAKSAKPAANRNRRLTNANRDLGFCTTPEGVSGEPGHSLERRTPPDDANGFVVADIPPDGDVSQPKSKTRSMPHRTDTAVQRPPRADRRPILSVCTVLILSGFLLGMTAATQLTTEFRVLITITGLTGVVAFIGLDHVSLRRKLNRERAEQAYMENRLVRHIISGDTAITDHDELMALARQATSIFELDEQAAARL